MSDLTMRSYDLFSESTAKYPHHEALTYTALGLCGESGEYAEKVKKELRDGTYDREGAVKELGDVLWYVARAARANGVTLEEVARLNMAKLLDRRDRGVLGGSGDAR